MSGPDRAGGEALSVGVRFTQGEAARDDGGGARGASAERAPRVSEGATAAGDVADTGARCASPDGSRRIDATTTRPAIGGRTAPAGPRQAPGAATHDSGGSPILNFAPRRDGGSAVGRGRATLSRGGASRRSAPRSPRTLRAGSGALRPSI